MKPILRSVGKYVGYAAYAMMVCVVTIYLFFPNERLKQLVAQQVNSDGRYDVTVESASLSFPPGIQASGIKIISPPEKPGDKPGKLYIDRFVFRPGLFSMLTDTKRYTVEIEMIGGRLDVQVATTGKAKQIDIKFSSLSMRKLPGIAKAISLPMTGTLNGSGGIKIPAEGLRRAEGKFTLACKSCTLGDGKTKVRMDFRPEHLKKKHPNWMAKEGVSLPKVRLGAFGGDIEIEGGKAMFQQFEALSPDGEGFLMGTITLREPFPFSNVDAYFKFKLDEKLKDKEAKWKGIEAGLAKGRRSDRYFGFSVRGRLKDPPRFLPSRYSSVERLYDKKGRATGGRRRGQARSMSRPRRPGMRARHIMRPIRKRRDPKKR